MLYHGSVQLVDNDADLALVGVEEPAFMNGITPMEIGETPHVQDDVLAVGYPLGGEDISSIYSGAVSPVPTRQALEPTRRYIQNHNNTRTGCGREFASSGVNMEMAHS